MLVCLHFQTSRFFFPAKNQSFSLFSRVDHTFNHSHKHGVRKRVPHSDAAAGGGVPGGPAVHDLQAQQSEHGQGRRNRSGAQRAHRGSRAWQGPVHGEEDPPGQVCDLCVCVCVCVCMCMYVCMYVCMYGCAEEIGGRFALCVCDRQASDARLQQRRFYTQHTYTSFPLLSSLSLFSLFSLFLSPSRSLSFSPRER